MTQKNLCHSAGCDCHRLFKFGITISGLASLHHELTAYLEFLKCFHGKHGYHISIMPMPRLFHLRLLLITKLVEPKSQFIRTSMVPVVHQQYNHLGNLRNSKVQRYVLHWSSLHFSLITWRSILDALKVMLRNRRKQTWNTLQISQSLSYKVQKRHSVALGNWGWKKKLGPKIKIQKKNCADSAT